MDKDKSIAVYTGDYKEMKVKPKILENVLGHLVQIAEFEEVSYMEILQIAIQHAYETNPYHYEEDRIISFLYWHDDYLFTLDGFAWTVDSANNPIMYMPYFFYTKMTKYKDVIHEEVFGRKVEIYVIQTSRPILVKIVNHIKQQESTSLNDTDVSKV